MNLMRDIIRLRDAAERCRAIACSNRLDAPIYAALALEIEGKIIEREVRFTAARAKRLPRRQPVCLAA